MSDEKIYLNVKGIFSSLHCHDNQKFNKKLKFWYMNNKNLLIILLITIIVISGGYVVLDKRKMGNTIETTTSTTKLALCSNQYYKTKYNANGRIVIDNWPCYEESTIINGHPCSSGASGGEAPNCCYAESFDKIKDLTCVQEISQHGTNFGCGLSQSNLEIISGLTNLEVLDLSQCSVDGDVISIGGDINKIIRNFKHLKEFTMVYTNREIKNSDCFRGLTELESLNIGLFDTDTFDFNDISTNIKVLHLGAVYNSPKFLHWEKLKDFTKLEDFDLSISPEVILANRKTICAGIKNWPNLKKMQWPWIEIGDLKDFDCSKYMDELQGRLGVNG